MEGYAGIGVKLAELVRLWPISEPERYLPIVMGSGGLVPATDVVDPCICAEVCGV